jgi:hypothetical protein
MPAAAQQLYFASEFEFIPGVGAGLCLQSMLQKPEQFWLNALR